MTGLRPLLFLSLAVAAICTPAAAEKLKPVVRYRMVQERGALVEPRPTTTVAFISVVNREGALRYWIAEQGFKGAPGDGRRPHLWVDGRTCPGLNAVVISMADLSNPDGDPPPLDPVPTDGGRITLTGPITPGGPGAMVVTDMLGPLFDWWQGASRQLAPCWRQERPVLNGRKLDPQIWP